MHIFNSSNHLIRQHQNSLHCETSGAEIEQILQRRTQQVHDQTMVVSFDSIEANVRNTYTTGQNFVDFRFVQKLWMASLNKDIRVNK